MVKLVLSKELNCLNWVGIKRPSLLWLQTIKLNYVTQSTLNVTVNPTTACDKHRHTYTQANTRRQHIMDS